MKHYKLLVPYLIERRFQIIMGFLALLIVDILQLFIPRIIKWAIDGMTLASVSRFELFKYALYIAASALVIGVFRFFWRYLIMGPARRVEEGLRESLFNHVQTLPTKFFDNYTAGDIMAHATNDITNIRMALGMGIVGLTDTIVLGCTSVIFMAYIHLELTFWALLPMPFIALFTRVFSKRLFDAYVDVQAGFSDIMEATRERFAGVRIIKAFAREDHEVEAMRRESEDYVKKNMLLVKLRGLIFPMVIFLTNVSLAIIIGVGGRKVILGSISPGDFVAFISYLGLLTWPVMAVGWVTNLIQRGSASLDRINMILEIPGEIEIEKRADKRSDRKAIGVTAFDSGNTDEKEVVSGDIELDSLHFSYPGSIDVLGKVDVDERSSGAKKGNEKNPDEKNRVEKNKDVKNEDEKGVDDSVSDSRYIGYEAEEAPFLKSSSDLKQSASKSEHSGVIKGVSFRIDEGSMVGIAGPPGSGKTTLVNLIPRLYTPDSGSITIAGKKASDIDIQTLRRSISFMPQEPFLFSGTIRENILFGDFKADDKRVGEVLEMAQLTDTISSFPKGIETIIGEKGVMLSGGQKQRIALARAFLKVSPILILDDPVSQVDMETASRIIKVIESFAGRRTVIIVSHRFSIFRKADRIAVLDKGRIAEQGTHSELIEKNGYYTRAWRMQESENEASESEIEIVTTRKAN